MTTPNADTQELLTTGIFFTVLTIISKLINYLSKKKLRGASSAFAAGIQVYDLMNNILNTTPASRIIIFKAMNGGGKIKLGSHLTINSVQGVSENPFIVDEWKRYRGLTVDEEYNRMLLDVSTKKVTKIKIDPNVSTPNALLQNIYKAVGVSYSEVHHIYDNKNEYYFMSIATEKQLTFDDNVAWRSEIDLNVRKIGRIYSKHLK